MTENTTGPVKDDEIADDHDIDLWERCRQWSEVEPETREEQLLFCYCSSLTAALDRLTAAVQALQPQKSPRRKSVRR